jgi:hypothetical protein
VRCALGILDGSPTGEIIFCSRHGNLDTLATLLDCLARADLVSPMTFSGSVHNATPGLIGQIRNERLSHTALAAGEHTLSAGLVEAFAHLKCDDCRNVIVLFADIKVPKIFREFEHDIVGDLALALRLELGAREKSAIAVGAGWQGARALFEAVESGASHILVNSSVCAVRAA